MLQVIGASDDGMEYGEGDAQLQLENGTPRSAHGNSLPLCALVRPVSPSRAPHTYCRPWSAAAPRLRLHGSSLICRLARRRSARTAQVLHHAHPAAWAAVRPHHLPRPRDAVPRVADGRAVVPCGGGADRLPGAASGRGGSARIQGKPSASCNPVRCSTQLLHTVLRSLACPRVRDLHHAPMQRRYPTGSS